MIHPVDVLFCFENSNPKEQDDTNCPPNRFTATFPMEYEPRHTRQPRLSSWLDRFFPVSLFGSFRFSVEILSLTNKPNKAWILHRHVSERKSHPQITCIRLVEAPLILPLILLFLSASPIRNSDSAVSLIHTEGIHSTANSLIMNTHQPQSQSQCQFKLLQNPFHHLLVATANLTSLNGMRPLTAPSTQAYMRLLSAEPVWCCMKHQGMDFWFHTKHIKSLFLAANSI